MPDPKIDIEHVFALARRRHDIVVADACIAAWDGDPDALAFVASVDRGDEPIVWDRGSSWATPAKLRYWKVGR